MEYVAAGVVATVVVPFMIGWWIGHPAFAAAAFGALGLTVLLRQVGIEADGGMLAWIFVASVLSAAAAGYGGRVRERGGEDHP